MNLRNETNYPLRGVAVILFMFLCIPYCDAMVPIKSGVVPIIANAFKIFSRQDGNNPEATRLHTVLLVGLSCLLIFTIIIIVCILLYDRTLSRKNAIAFKNVHDLLRYKEAFYSLSEENLRLKARLNASNASNSVSLQDESSEVIEDPDEQLFAGVRHLILSEKLYLQPDLCRDDIVRKVYVPKNKFGQLFKRFAGTTFNGYVNALRLKDAAGKLIDNPMLTVEGIATECGFNSRQNFYRLFCDQFGMTPSEFRRAARRKKEED